MATLRISQQPGSGPDRHYIAVEAEIPRFQPQRFNREIEFALSPEEAEQIRWYLEDYLQFAEAPAPQIAARVERLMAERGEALFRAIFEGQNEALLLWAAAAPHLSSTRIEIDTGIAEAMSIPWELIRNPHTRVNLALSAKAFVRSQPGAQASVASEIGGKVRILLVICRPAADEDVPFRSVAGRLVKDLSDADREAFQLDVLRPPTYEQLAKELKLAWEKGEPYHIVHFDGHGAYADPKDFANADRPFSKLMLDSAGTGPRGFLCFEHSGGNTHGQFVDGFTIGGLLRDAGVPILILNACKSAFADANPQPNQDSRAAIEEIGAYGSLAQAVMNTGTAGVVAMRYSVYVVTAAQFVAELYAALARGRTLGEAVAWARGNLAVQPMRKIAYDARPLQDWSVPVVWERTPLRLWPETQKGAPLKITLGRDGATAGALDPQLPKTPDVGFLGRDETLYALDRAFDAHSIVLLHAFAGSGKTTTAAEFARWYKLTGGIEGPVLFTSFERRLPLARVLDKIGEIFGSALERSGIQWGAANDTQRREIALSVLRQVPVLWIWDNVEPITGFPAGTPSDWSAAEQQELRDILSDARNTKAKFLLTSRRDEHAWLGEMPRRIKAPPMPMQERLQLAGAIVQHRGRRLENLPDLRPLLRFTQGNPLTILVTVGEALRAGIDSPERLDAFVTALRSGETNFADEETEGRTRSLGASLSYGFASAFNDEERKRLALLHLFQGFVDVDALRLMGNLKADWALAEVRGLTREQGIALLDRAAELGLLLGLGAGYYSVHPALPWYFRDLFVHHFAGEAADGTRRAFVEAIGDLGNLYHNEYITGKNEILPALMAEEDNLLAAWRLARQHGWWPCVVKAMQGLRMLYTETGRGPAWRRLVDAITPDFVDLRTDLARPGRENEWSIVTNYRILLAEEERDLAKAERLQRLCTEWDRERAGTALATAPEKRSLAQRNAIRTLAASLHELGEIQRGDDNPACVDSYREAFGLSKSIADRAAQETCAFNLGIAYTNIAAFRDYDAAERWLQQSLNLLAPGDEIGRAKTLGQLGTLFFHKFEDARAKGRAEEELLSLVNQAVQNHQQALHLFPSTAIRELGTVHNQLGYIYDEVGDFDRALQHYRQTIRYSEQADDILTAGMARVNVAVTLFKAKRSDDARAYAEASLANFRAFGGRTGADILAYIQNTEQFIADIDRAAAEQQAKP